MSLHVCKRGKMREKIEGGGNQYLSFLIIILLLPFNDHIRCSLIPLLQKQCKILKKQARVTIETR